VIAAPPLDAGAVQDTVAEALPPAATTLVGAEGTTTFDMIVHDKVKLPELQDEDDQPVILTK
jgi:hypothetical protein